MKEREDMTVLLLEDQPLITIDTEAMLKQAGFSRIVHFSSVGPALDWLEKSAPDFVVMETVLQGEPSTALAKQLNALKVPFLVYTGAARRLSDNPLFRGAEWLPKPSEIQQLMPAIAKVLSNRSTAEELRATDGNYQASS